MEGGVGPLGRVHTKPPRQPGPEVVWELLWESLRTGCGRDSGLIPGNNESWMVLSMKRRSSELHFPMMAPVTGREGLVRQGQGTRAPTRGLSQTWPEMSELGLGRWQCNGQRGQWLAIAVHPGSREQSYKGLEHKVWKQEIWGREDIAEGKHGHSITQECLPIETEGTKRVSLTQSGPTVSIAASAEAGMEGEVCVLRRGGSRLNQCSCLTQGWKERTVMRRQCASFMTAWQSTNRPVIFILAPIPTATL